MRGVNWLKSKFMEKGENVHTRKCYYSSKNSDLVTLENDDDFIFGVSLNLR